MVSESGNIRNFHTAWLDSTRNLTKRRGDINWGSDPLSLQRKLLRRLPRLLSGGQRRKGRRARGTVIIVVREETHGDRFSRVSRLVTKRPSLRPSTPWRVIVRCVPGTYVTTLAARFHQFGFHFPCLFETPAYSRSTSPNLVRENVDRLRRRYISVLCSCQGGYPARWKCFPNTTVTSTTGSRLPFAAS